MKNMIVVGIGVAVVVLVSLAQMVGVGWAGAGLAAFAVLMHAPSFVPVRVIRMAVGSRLGAYPEAPFFALIFLAWGVAAVTQGGAGYALSAGVVFALSIGIQFALVRSVDQIVKGTLFLGGHNPSFDAEGMMAVVKRVVFALRVVTAVFSLIVLWRFVAVGVETFWWAPGAVLAPVLSFTTVASHGLNLKAVAERAALSAESTISASVADRPPKGMIYYTSSKAANHKWVAPAVERLKREGVPTALVCREPHALKACSEAKPDYLWRAFTIETLDFFARPSVKAAFYVNDGSKNPHCVRFNEMAHILLTEYGVVAKRKDLHGSMAIYDAIVAPNAATAALWRRSSSPEMASRVVLLDPEAIALPVKSGSQENFCSVSIRIQPGALAYRDVSQGIAVIRALLNWVEAEENRSLWVSVDTDSQAGAPDEHPDSGQALRQVIQVASLRSSRVTVVENAGTSIHSSSDIVVATETDDLWGLAQAGKPLLLLSPKSFGQDVELLWGSQDEVVAKLNNASLGCFVPSERALQQRHFNALNEMIDAVWGTKQAGGVKA